MCAPLAQNLHSLVFQGDAALEKYLQYSPLLVASKTFLPLSILWLGYALAQHHQEANPVSSNKTHVWEAQILALLSEKDPELLCPGGGVSPDL